MITGILSQVTGQLEKRFLLNSFLPTLVFGLLLCLAVAAGSEGTGAALDLWEAQPANVQVLLAIAAVAAVFLVANLVANGTLGIIRLYEGYAWPASWFANWGRNYHHRRASNLLPRDRDAFEQRYPVYPRQLKPEDVAPTRLWNVLRS